MLSKSLLRDRVGFKNPAFNQFSDSVISHSTSNNENANQMLDVENLKDNDFPAETFNIIDVEDLNDGFEEDKNDLDSVSEAFSVGSSVGPTLNPPLIVKEEDEKSQICEIAVNLRIDSAIRKSDEYPY